jgi:hypothetical protein
MQTQFKFTTIEQDTPSKVPMLHLGDISPAVMRKFKNACHGYFKSKEISEDKQVRKILAGICDNHIQEWLTIDHEHYLALNFTEFMINFRAA